MGGWSFGVSEGGDEDGDLAARRREKTQKGKWNFGERSFGGIEDFLTTRVTRVTREHKDGHVFLVFVVCVCFVVERGFSRKEARENAKRKMEFGRVEFRSFGVLEARSSDRVR